MVQAEPQKCRYKARFKCALRQHHGYHRRGKPGEVCSDCKSWMRQRGAEMSLDALKTHLKAAEEL